MLPTAAGHGLVDHRQFRFASWASTSGTLGHTLEREPTLFNFSVDVVFLVRSF